MSSRLAGGSARLPRAIDALRLSGRNVGIGVAIMTYRISATEQDRILAMIRDGLSNGTISKRTGRAASTVTRLRRMFRRAGKSKQGGKHENTQS